MKINKSLVSSLQRLAKKGNNRKERKGGSIKEGAYLKIKIYDSRGKVIGALGPGESVNYQELERRSKN
ncbi:unnamed protein product [marine sediment metagenome]|uniref:Uncharacterized protein n=1 Tax=marine sediment metagenome TaxID=412755 RepID=X1U5L8_9ZZZZ